MAKPTRSRAVLATQLVIYLYVIARFVLVFAAFKQYGVNPWVFLAIDLVTAAPYAYAWPLLALALYRKQFASAAVWGAIVSASFAAPYAYVALSAHNLPVQLQIGLAAFVACLAILSVRHIINKISRTSL